MIFEREVEWFGLYRVGLKLGKRGIHKHVWRSLKQYKLGCHLRNPLEGNESGAAAQTPWLVGKLC